MRFAARLAEEYILIVPFAYHLQFRLNNYYQLYYIFELRFAAQLLFRLK